MRATYTTPKEIAAILKGNGDTLDAERRARYYKAAQAVADAIDLNCGVSFAPSNDTTVGRDYFVEAVELSEVVTITHNQILYPAPADQLPFGEGAYLHIGYYGFAVVKIGETNDDGKTPITLAVVSQSDSPTPTSLVPVTLEIDGKLVEISGDKLAIGERYTPGAPHTASFDFEVFDIIHAPPGVQEISRDECVSLVKRQAAEYSTQYGNVEVGPPLDFNQLGGGVLSSTSRRLLKKYEHTSLWV